MRSWWKKWAKLIHLPLADQVLVGQAFVVVAGIKVGLKLLPFQQFRRIYSLVTSGRKNSGASDKSIAQWVWAIQQVSGSLSAACLPQALALACFLRHDKAVKLVVGVRNVQLFEAHAWVEKNGKPLIGQLPDTHFQPLWVWM